MLTFLYFSIFYFLLSRMLFSSSPQRRLLCMILILLNFILLFICLHLEYIAFVLLILYVGAISVLFLFIIMLVSLTKISFFYRSFFIVFIFYSLFFLCFLYFFFNISFVFFDFNSFCLLTKEVFVTEHSVIYAKIFGLSFFNCQDVFFQGLNLMLNNIELEQLGFLLWTTGFLYILASSLVLIVSILGTVLILKGMIFSNILKKSIIHKSVFM